MRPSAPSRAPGCSTRCRSPTAGRPTSGSSSARPTSSRNASSTAGGGPVVEGDGSTATPPTSAELELDHESDPARSRRRRTTMRRDVRTWKPQPVAADDVRERHGQVGRARAPWRLVLLEHDRVEARPRWSSASKRSPEPVDVLSRAQREREPRPGALARRPTSDADAAGNDPAPPPSLPTSPSGAGAPRRRRVVSNQRVRCWRSSARCR